jgi:hypothetical protein
MDTGISMECAKKCHTVESAGIPFYTVAFDRRCIRPSFVTLLAPYLPSTPQSRALLERRIDALGADRIYELKH